MSKKKDDNYGKLSHCAVHQIGRAAVDVVDAQRRAQRRPVVGVDAARARHDGVAPLVRLLRCVAQYVVHQAEIRQFLTYIINN